MDNDRASRRNDHFIIGGGVGMLIGFCILAAVMLSAPVTHPEGIEFVLASKTLTVACIMAAVTASSGLLFACIGMARDEKYWERSLLKHLE